MKRLIGFSKYCAVVVCVGLLTTVSVSAQTPSAETEAELIKIQNDWAAARVKRDVPFLEKLYAKEFSIIALDGTLVTREADIANFASGDLKPEIVKNDEMKVSLYGDTAVVTGIEYVRGTYKNSPANLLFASPMFTSAAMDAGNWSNINQPKFAVKTRKRI